MDAKRKEITMWECSHCKRQFHQKETAESCCKCHKCGRSLSCGHFHSMTCKDCQKANQVKRYKEAQAASSPLGVPCVYSEVLNEYFNAEYFKDEILDYIENSGIDLDPDDSPDVWREKLQVYVCEPQKPDWPGVSEMWSDYLPSDSCDGDCDPPGDYEAVDKVVDEYLKNCGPWSFIPDHKKWNGEIERNYS